MINKGINAIRLKLCTEQLSEMKTFASQVLGGKEIYTEPGLCVFELQNGNIFEMCGPGSNYPDYLFKKNNMVVSFKVNDLDEAMHNAKANGMKIISEMQAVGNCYIYSHLADNDGNIIELNQDVSIKT